MNKLDLQNRTKKFAIEIYFLCEELESQSRLRSYLNQLKRCSSSVGANYRAACRAKSTADFINKLKIVEEEIDESGFFLEILMEISKIKKDKIKVLYDESCEILAIIVSSINTARKNYIKEPNQEYKPICSIN